MKDLDQVLFNGTVEMFFFIFLGFDNLIELVINIVIDVLGFKPKTVLLDLGIVLCNEHIEQEQNRCPGDSVFDIPL